MTDRYNIRSELAGGPSIYSFKAPTHGIVYIRNNRLDQGASWDGGGYFISTSSDGNENNTFNYFNNTANGQIDLRLAEGDEIY